MKQWFSLFIVVLFLGSACNSSRKNTAPATPDPAVLEGTWELTYITGPRIVFNGLYPDKKPFIKFDVAGQKISGNTSCNNYSGKLVVNGSRIDLTGPMAVTKMFCGGQGEATYLDMLKMVNNWLVEGNTLTLKTGDVPAMKFAKKS